MNQIENQYNTVVVIHDFFPNGSPFFMSPVLNSTKCNFLASKKSNTSNSWDGFGSSSAFGQKKPSSIDAVNTKNLYKEDWEDRRNWDVEQVCKYFESAGLEGFCGGLRKGELKKINSFS